MQAIAAAQAIAARLSAQAVGTAATPIANPSNTWAVLTVLAADTDTATLFAYSLMG